MTVFTAGDCTPFTYLILCLPTNELYYGVRYAVGCQPSDLWSIYFTSSKKIAKRIALFGLSAFKYEVRRTFDCPHKARLWEYKVLKRMKVIQDPQWLNTTNGVPFQKRKAPANSKRWIFCSSTQSYQLVDHKIAIHLVSEGLAEFKGPPKPKGHGQKVSDASKGKSKSQAHISAITKSFKNNPKNQGYNVYTDGNNNLRLRPGEPVPDGYYLGSCTKGRVVCNKNKGKTYEEIYGPGKSQSIKEFKSHFLKENNPSKQMKGKSYEELYGVQESLRLKEIRGRAGKKNTKEYLIYKNDSLVFVGSRLDAESFIQTEYKRPKGNNLYKKQWLSESNIRVETRRKPH